MKRLSDAQKAAIQDFRADGLGYKSIAEKLSLSRDTVRSFCIRNHIPDGKKEMTVETGLQSADNSDERTEVKVGSTVFVISTGYSDNASETLEKKLEKLIFQDALKQCGSYHFVQN